MKFAFLLFRYFPQSGLARDALAIAERLAARGHQVDFIAGDWQGKQPAGKQPAGERPAESSTAGCRRLRLVEERRHWAGGR